MKSNNLEELSLKFVHGNSKLSFVEKRNRQNSKGRSYSVKEIRGKKTLKLPVIIVASMTCHYTAFNISLTPLHKYG